MDEATRVRQQQFLNSLYDMKWQVDENIKRLNSNIDKEKAYLWKVEHAIAELELELGIE